MLLPKGARSHEFCYSPVKQREINLGRVDIFHSKSWIIKTNKKMLVLMSSGKYKRNLFYIVKQYFENLKQVKRFLKSALLQSKRILKLRKPELKLSLTIFKLL